MLGKRQAAVNAGAVVDVDLVGRSAWGRAGQAGTSPWFFVSKDSGLPVFLPVSPCYLCLEESI